MSHSAGFHDGTKVAEGLTRRDVKLGKRAVAVTNVLYVLTFAFCLAVGIYVFQSVPPGTAQPGGGRRGADGLPMPILMSLPLLLFALFWRIARGGNKSAYRMAKKARVRSYIIAVVVNAAFIFVYVGGAMDMLRLGGAFAG